MGKGILIACVLTVQELGATIVTGIVVDAHYNPILTVQEITYLGYNPDTGNNDKSYKIDYLLPNPATFGPGPYPVFMWTAGTFEAFTDDIAMLFVTQMAARGFIAGTVQYFNTGTAFCNTDSPISQSIYDSTVSTSAARTLCGLSKADCSRGITVSGVSQGSVVASMAANWNAQVQAAYLMGVSARLTVTPLPCVFDANTTLPASRMMLVTGQSDSFFMQVGQPDLEKMSGQDCADGTISCLAASGGGWYIVQDTQVQDGVADHCYFNVGGCVGPRDSGWYPGTNTWSLTPNLDWLATLGTHR